MGVVIPLISFLLYRSTLLVEFIEVAINQAAYPFTELGILHKGFQRLLGFEARKYPLSAEHMPPVCYVSSLIYKGASQADDYASTAYGHRL